MKDHPLANTVHLYNTLRTSATDALKYTQSKTWDTSKYSVSPKVPLALDVQNCKLPGISPMARDVAERPSNARIPGNGQIPLSELSQWYKERKYSKKNTPGEWKESATFVNDRSTNRMTVSSDARNASNTLRASIASEVKTQEESVSDNFKSRMSTVREHLDVERSLYADLQEAIRTMTNNIENLENWTQTRTKWPIKVYRKCMEFRNQRIGIDLVLDDVEVQLGKEFDNLTTTVTKSTDYAMARAIAGRKDMEEVAALLLEDINRKDSAMLIDKKMQNLSIFEVNKDTDMHSSIVVRPKSAINTVDWKEVTDMLIERAKISRDQMNELVQIVKEAMSSCEKLISEQADIIDDLLELKVKSSLVQVDLTLELLQKARVEADTLEVEIQEVETLIENSETPLLRATTRLEARRSRPSLEKTSDCAHDALIQEVSELSAAVNALENQLDTHLKNLDELKREEGTLEEELAIKKLTVVLEGRCQKIRGFLAATSDPYTVQRMLNDDEFCDIMTR